MSFDYYCELDWQTVDLMAIQAAVSKAITRLTTKNILYADVEFYLSRDSSVKNVIVYLKFPKVTVERLQPRQEQPDFERYSAKHYIGELHFDKIDGDENDPYWPTHVSMSIDSARGSSRFVWYPLGAITEEVGAILGARYTGW